MSQPQPPQPPTPTLAHPAVQVTQIVVQALTFLAMVYLGAQANKNQEQIARVSAHAHETADTTAQIKVTVDNSSSGPIARELQLWAAWKYLDSIADESGKPADRQKADEAKKVYNEYKSK